MRIRLYVDTLIFRMQYIGGVSVYWSEILKRALEDDEIELVLVDAPGSDRNVLYPPIGESADLKVHEHWDNLMLQRLTRVRLPDCCADGAIFHGTYYRTAANANVKNVLTVHDATHQVCCSGVKRFLNDQLKRKTIHDTDAIVCVSENTKKDLLRFFPEAAEKSISVIYNGADEAYRQVGNPEMLLGERFSELNGRPYLLYVGDRSPYKNFEFMSRLLYELPDFDLVVAGGKPFLLQETESFGNCVGRVHKYSGLATDDLNVLYNLAHALVYPSHYEGFGIPILEAMKAGCPVIAFNNSAVPEVMGDSPLLLENDDLPGTIAAIDLLREERFRQRVIDRQNENAVRFSWDNAYAGVKRVYEGMMESAAYGIAGNKSNRTKDLGKNQDPAQRGRNG